MSKALELQSTHGLSERELDRQVSDKDLERISRSCCKHWKFLPAYLELEAILALDIDRKGVDEREKRHEFLLKWREIKGSAATYKQLISALLEIKSVEDAERVCVLVKESTHELSLDMESKDILSGLASPIEMWSLELACE